jgi:hypothetical protein
MSQGKAAKGLECGTVQAGDIPDQLDPDLAGMHRRGSRLKALVGVSSDNDDQALCPRCRAADGHGRRTVGGP